MSKLRIRLLLSLSIAVVPLVSINAARAQSALRVVADLRSYYQQKVEQLISNTASPVFLGTASVAQNRAFPWMVSLQIKGDQSAARHFCGGVVIDKFWVLTAAHCVSIGIPSADTSKIVTRIAGTADDSSAPPATQPMVEPSSQPTAPPTIQSAPPPLAGAAITPSDPNTIQVLVGSNVLSIGGALRSIARIVLHPEFHVTAEQVPENDLALIRIAGDQALTAIKVATEPESAAFLKDGALVRILGWGTSSFNPQGAVSNNLLYAFVNVIDHSKCNDATAYDGAVTASMFCAGLGVSDACQGDSGGPAVGYTRAEPKLVGITSWGIGCNKQQYPGIYVNVAKYAGWIGETIFRTATSTLTPTATSPPPPTAVSTIIPTIIPAVTSAARPTRTPINKCWRRDLRLPRPEGC